MRTGVSELVEGIERVFTEPECSKCKVLQEWLDIEREKRDYYEKLLLTQAGILKGEVDISSEVSFQSVGRITTMSQLRKMAAVESVKRRDKTLTEAEKKFEDALNKVEA